MVFIGMGLVLGLAALGAAIGQGIATQGFLNGMARQPELEGRMRTWWFVAMAFIEAFAIYGFVGFFVLLSRS